MIPEKLVYSALFCKPKTSTVVLLQVHILVIHCPLAAQLTGIQSHVTADAGT